MWGFKLQFAILFLAILIIEIFIGVFIHDQFIRPFVGDFLVVPLLYFALRSLLMRGVNAQLMGVLLFAYLVECSQYFNLVHLIGLGESSASKLLYGTCFDWIDMLSYTAGAGVLFVFNLLEKRKLERKV